MGTREWEDFHADDAQADRDHWNDKYWDSVPECDLHGDTQYYNVESGEYECYDCIDEEDMQNG